MPPQCQSGFTEYVETFTRFFSDPLGPDVEVKYIPGNADIGCVLTHFSCTLIDVLFDLSHSLGVAHVFSKHEHQRYQCHFGCANQLLNAANHSLVLLDVPGIVRVPAQESTSHDRLQVNPLPLFLTTLHTLTFPPLCSTDDRDYSDVIHMLPLSSTEIHNITAKSFSPSRHISRPDIHLLSLSGDTPSHAYTRPCAQSPPTYRWHTHAPLRPPITMMWLV